MDVQGAQASHKLVVFRADASVQIGTGHVMRCLALADALQARGAQCDFICRPHAGNLLDLIDSHGHKAIALPAPEENYRPSHGSAYAAWLGTDWAVDAEQTRQALSGQSVDWLVVDHYSLDQQWEHALRPHCRRLMVTDDLADRPHDCDLLLDQNLGRNEQDYAGLLPACTRILIGPKYALLRPEFAQWRPYSLERRASGELKKLLITMGGMDKDNATGQVLEALKICTLPSDLRIDVVMGAHAPWLDRVQNIAATMPWKVDVLVDVKNMAKLMAESDLAICSLGMTTWERAAVGLPSLIKVIAENQTVVAEIICAIGAGIALDESMLCNQIKTLSFGLLNSMSRNAAKITDGNGLRRVLEEMKV